MLNKEESVRYSRHLNLPEFGEETQVKLKDSKVLVVGTGGLGAPLLQYLTAAGVGTIGVVDYDVVDISNLQRQVLFSTKDVGRSKTEVAIRKLQTLNPHVEFKEHHIKLDSSNALEIFRSYDVVADGTDNFPTRYLVNDACVLTDRPNVYASIFQFEGQVSVFNHLDKPGERGPNYRDLFPTPPPPGMVPSCAEGGVLGVLPGIVGSMQATEVIKIITGIGTPLSGTLLVFDALNFTQRKLNVVKDPSNPLTGKNKTIDSLIDYDEFCGLKSEDDKSIGVHELKALIDDGSDFQLIDVREPYEYEEHNLGGVLIPLKSLDNKISEIERQKKVVIHCKTGVRSLQAVRSLQKEHGFENLYNLEGGIQEWIHRFGID